jgi:hypothetical protein
MRNRIRLSEAAVQAWEVSLRGVEVCRTTTTLFDLAGDDAA